MLSRSSSHGTDGTVQLGTTRAKQHHLMLLCVLLAALYPHACNADLIYSPRSSLGEGGGRTELLGSILLIWCV